MLKKSSKISINHFYVKDWLFTLMTDGEWNTEEATRIQTHKHENTTYQIT